MLHMKHPVSLLSFFKNKVLQAALVSALITGLTLSTITLFTLESIIKKNVQQELAQYQFYLNNLPPNKLQNDSFANLIIENQIASSLILKTPTDELIHKTEYQGKAFSPFENAINYLFFKKPLLIELQNNKVHGIIQLNLRSKPYLFYYLLLSFCIVILTILLPLLLILYLHSTTKLLYNNIHPIIQVLHDFNQKDIRHQRAPYSHLKEIQIFNESFNILLDKLESTKQNLVEQNTLLNFQATHDTLTKLPNRQYFQNLLIRDFNHNQNSYMVILFIDNNKFKTINDTFGHQAGDAVLIETAKRLKQTLRGEDFIARLGGDEFAAILRRVEHYTDLVRICEKLVHACHEPLIFNQDTISFSFSVGASYAYQANSIEEFLHHADLAMYQAKNSERKWYIYKREDAFSYHLTDEQKISPKHK